MLGINNPSLIFLLAFPILYSVLACSAAAPKPGKGAAAWPADTSSLDYIVMESDWIGQIRIPSPAAGSGARRVKVDKQEHWQDFDNLETEDLPWPAASDGG